MCGERCEGTLGPMYGMNVLKVCNDIKYLFLLAPFEYLSTIIKIPLYKSVVMSKSFFIIGSLLSKLGGGNIP